jgi:hypothetical protein
VLNIDTLWHDPQCSSQLEALKQTFSVSLIYVTAYTFQETLQYVRKHKLPLPTIFVCESGAALHLAPRYIRHARWGYSLRTIDPLRLQYVTHASGLTLSHKASQSCYVYKGTKQQCAQFNAYAQQDKLALYAIYRHGKVMVFHESITSLRALACIFHHCDSSNDVIIATEHIDDDMYALPHFKFIILASSHRKRQSLPHMYFTVDSGIEGIISGWHYHLQKQV